MKLLIPILMLISILGCTDRSVIAGDSGELNLMIYRLQGKELECVNMHYRLSCNWGKYNNLGK